MGILGYMLTLTMLLNGIVWLAISSLILYNIYEYTVDKHHLRKDLPMYFKKYARFMG